MAAGMDFKRGIEQFYKFTVESSPSMLALATLKSAGILNNNSVRPPASTPDTPAASGGAKDGVGGGSRGKKPLSKLDRKHSQAQAARGRSQYSKGGCVHHKNIAAMEKNMGRKR